MNNTELGEIKRILKKFGDSYESRTGKQLTPQDAVKLYDVDEGFQEGIQAIDSKFVGQSRLKQLERAVGEKFMSKLVPDYSAVESTRKLGLVESVLADDLGSLLRVGQTLWPYIKPVVSYYGPKVLDWLYHKAKGKMDDFLLTTSGGVKNHGSGPGLVKTSGIDPFFEESKLDMMKGWKNDTVFTSDYVNKMYIASILSPEYPFTSCPRAPFSGFEQTSPVRVQANIPVLAGAANTTFFILCPAAVWGDGTNLTWISKSQDTSALNTNTGVYSNPQRVVGYLNDQVTPLQNHLFGYAGGCSIRFVPAQSLLNKQGVVQLLPAISSSIKFGDNVYVPNNTLQINPFLKSVDLVGTSEVRTIYMPDYTDDEQSIDILAKNTNTLLASTADFQYFYMRAFGLNATAGSEIGTVYIEGWVDVWPTGSGAKVNPPTNPPQGAKSTHSALSNIIRACPWVVHYSMAEAMALAEVIMAAPCREDYFTAYMIDHIQKNSNSSSRKIPRYQGGYADGNYLQVGDVDSSFDF